MRLPTGQALATLLAEGLSDFCLVSQTDACLPACVAADRLASAVSPLHEPSACRSAGAQCIGTSRHNTKIRTRNDGGAVQHEDLNATRKQWRRIPPRQGPLQ